MRTDGPTDGRTDMTMLIVTFRNFAKTPKNILSETFLIQRGTERDIINNLHWPSSNVPVFLVFLNFLDRFWKNIDVSNLMKIRPLGAELFCADERTDKHDEANSRFSQFCEHV
jgi:hypothetical protein